MASAINATAASGWPGPRGSTERLEPATHDRREQRRATVIRDKSLAEAQNFPGIVALGRITSRRRQLGGGPADPPAVRYFLLSKALSPRQLLLAVRSHWSVENQLHWMLDVNFNEDACRARSLPPRRQNCRNSVKVCVETPSEDPPAEAGLLWATKVKRINAMRVN